MRKIIYDENSNTILDAECSDDDPFVITGCRDCTVECIEVVMRMMMNLESYQESGCSSVILTNADGCQGVALGVFSPDKYVLTEKDGKSMIVYGETR